MGNCRSQFARACSRPLASRTREEYVALMDATLTSTGDRNMPAIACPCGGRLFDAVPAVRSRDSKSG
jgi:hypothetical protein